MDYFTPHESATLTRAPIWTSGTSTRLSIATSAATGQLAERTVFRIQSTVDCYVAIGDAAAVTADLTYTLLSANQPEYIMTGEGDVSRYISAVDTAGAGGTLYITECR